MPAPAELPADFDFSKQGPPSELPADFDFGGATKAQQPQAKAGYLQELWRQADLPGIVKSLKEHPAETVANAIGGLFAPLNPNFTQSPQGEAMKENLTRSPQSAAAALTLGGLAAAPAVGKLVPGVGEAASTAARAASGAASGVGKAVINPSTYHGMWGPVVAGEMLGLPRHVTAGITLGPRLVSAAVKGAKSALAEPEATAAAAKAAAPAAEAVQEAAKAPGQTLAEADGQIWGKLSPDDKLNYAHLEGAGETVASRNAAPLPYVPRTPADYGVKAAEVPPQPAPSASATPQAATPAPTLASAVPTAKVQPIRLEPASAPAPEPAATPEPTQPKPASGATAAKSARYADAISKWAKDMGMTPKDIADQWGTTTPEVRGQILLELKRKGYLGANETIPKTSAAGIVDALKAKAATIKPPAGFSLGSMKSQ